MSDISDVERSRRAIGRAGYMGALLGLLLGIGLIPVRQPDLSRTVLAATLAILLALPVVNVIAILTEEIRRRDWPFVLAAAVVLGLLAFTVVSRLP